MDTINKMKNDGIVVEYIIKNRNKLLNLVRKYNLEKDEAEDILQEISIKLLTHIEQYRGDAKFSTFAYRVAVNEICMYLRNKKRKNTLANKMTDYTKPLLEKTNTPEQECLEKERYENIRNFLETAHSYLGNLDAKTFLATREIIMDGEYPTELTLAEMTNVPCFTMRSRRQRMKQSLREVFSKDQFF